MIVLGILSLILSGVTYLVRSTHWRAIPLALRLIVVLIAGYPLGDSYAVETLLLISLAGECFFYFRDTVAVVLSLAAITGVAAMQVEGRVWELTSHRLGPEGLVVLVLMPLAFVAISCCAKRFLQRYQTAGAAATRLNEAVLDFVETNTTLQAELVEAKKTISEAERHRIAEELHDQLGYSFVNIRMLAEAALRTTAIEDREARELIADIRTQADESLRAIRAQLRAVRAKVEPAITLSEALTRLRRAFRHTHVKVDVSFGDAPLSVSPRFDGTIYRLVQEGIANAIRHGRADHIEVRLQRVADAMAVVIQDNGSGTTGTTPGIGSESIRRRIAELGGSVESGNTTAGYVLEARVPLRKENG